MIVFNQYLYFIILILFICLFIFGMFSLYKLIKGNLSESQFTGHTFSLIFLGIGGLCAIIAFTLNVNYSSKIEKIYYPNDFYYTYIQETKRNKDTIYENNNYINIELVETGFYKSFYSLNEIDKIRDSCFILENIIFYNILNDINGTKENFIITKEKQNKSNPIKL